MYSAEGQSASYYIMLFLPRLLIGGIVCYNSDCKGGTCMDELSMHKNRILADVKRIVSLELEMTKFNNERSLTVKDHHLTVSQVGSTTLLMDLGMPESSYYNRNNGYAANDFTFPAFRGKGCQTALIRHRLSMASSLGLDRVFADVEFGTTSHANMLKTGFQTVFINTFWLKNKS